MTEERPREAASGGGRPRLEAGRCPDGHLSYPAHDRCPECGEPQTGTVDLSERTAEVLTWTTSTAPPPGVREPNTVAVVEFDVDGTAVRAIGGVVDGSEDGVEGDGAPDAGVGDERDDTPGVAVGDEVRPAYVEQLRDPEAGIRHPDSQEWDGFRFEPIRD